MSELDPVNDALERLEWQDAREDAPERSPLAAFSRRAALTGGAAGLVSTMIAACGGDGNKPASSKAQSGTPASGIFDTSGKLKFVLVNHVTTNPFFVPTRYGAEDACKLLGLQLPVHRLQELQRQRDGQRVQHRRHRRRRRHRGLPRRQEGVQPAHRGGAEGQDPGPRLQRGRAEQRAAGLHRPGPVRLRRGDGQADPGSRPLRRRRAVHRHARAVQHPAADRRRPQRPQEGLGHQDARHHHRRGAAGGAVGHQRVRAEPPRDQGLLRRRRRAARRAWPRRSRSRSCATRASRAAATTSRRSRRTCWPATRSTSRSISSPTCRASSRSWSCTSPRRRRRCRASPTSTPG